MKIKCKKTKLSKDDLDEVKTVSREGFEYDVNIGEEYLVMGMLTHTASGCLYYLTDTGGGSNPMRYPYLLFEVSDSRLPPDWHIKVYGRTNLTSHTLWGFRELCEEEDFYERLMDREYEALEIYFKYKIELEQRLEDERWMNM